MIEGCPDLEGKQVLVMGLGTFGGGASTVEYLLDRGANVTVTDLATSDELEESLERLRGRHVSYVLGEHCREDFREADLVIVNPAVPLDSPYLEEARRAGTPLESSINLFVKQCPASITGITGTVGKSTTTALAGHLMTDHIPSKVWTGGNIGNNLLNRIDEIEPSDQVVLELSSFQLQLLRKIRWSPDTAIITTVFPNHLDRHETYEHYLRAKRTLIDFQASGDQLILYRGDRQLREWGQDAPATVYQTDTREIEGPGVFVRGDWIHFRSRENEQQKVIPTSLVPLPGAFNLQNALQAIAAALLNGVSPSQVGSSLPDFQPLPHHFEEVGSHGAYRFIDDSVATSPRGTVVALEALEDSSVVPIIGGYDKGQEMEEMIEAVIERAAGAILIGETAEDIAGHMERERPEIPYKRVRDLGEGVREAIGLLPEDRGIVLLSPGFASWDMFEDYRHRGNAFREAVQALEGD